MDEERERERGLRQADRHRDRDGRELEGADVAGAGRHGRREVDAGGEQRRLTQRRLDAHRLRSRREARTVADQPATERSTAGPSCAGAPRPPAPRAAGRARARAQAAASRAANRSAPGSRWAAIAATPDDQEGRDGQAHEHRGRDDPADREHEDGERRDRDHDRVSTIRSTTVPRIVDRAPGPVAQVVAADQLAEARRQDVVREVAHQRRSVACCGTARSASAGGASGWRGGRRRARRRPAGARSSAGRRCEARLPRPRGRPCGRRARGRRRDDDPAAARSRRPRDPPDRPIGGSRAGGRAARACSIDAARSDEQIASDHPQGRQPVDDAPLEADGARLLEVAGGTAISPMRRPPTATTWAISSWSNTKSSEFRWYGSASSSRRL